MKRLSLTIILSLLIYQNLFVSGGMEYFDTEGRMDFIGHLRSVDRIEVNCWMLEAFG